MSHWKCSPWSIQAFLGMHLGMLQLCSRGKVSGEVHALYVYIISKQLTISTRWWWKVVLHNCTIPGAGLQMTLLKAVRVDIRRKGSIADSTLQKMHREACATYNIYIYIVRYLLSATMYYRPLNLLDRRTNQLTCSTNL